MAAKLQSYPAHPFSEVFPIHDGAPMWQLRDDLKENGQELPIVLYQGKVLDGRRRQACLIGLGIKPKYIHFKGSEDEALKKAISLNLPRRHLSDSDRAIVAAKLAQLPRGNPKLTGQGSENGSNGANAPIGRLTTEQAAEVLNVSEGAVKRAKAIVDRPDLQVEVQQGEKSLSVAAVEAKQTAEVFCARCQRIGAPTKNCKACLELRQKAARRKPRVKRSTGKIAFDAKAFHAHFGGLVRLIDAAGKAYKAKESIKANMLRAEAGDFKKHFADWLADISKGEVKL